MSWLSAEQALAALGTKPQTLYANVSRGRIRAKPDPADSRRSLYFAEDIRRLAARQAGRRRSETVAAEAIEWGDPVLPSALSTISGGRLFYRGRDAVAFSETATLEDAAALLWDIKAPLQLVGRDGDQAPERAVAGDGNQGLRAAMLALASRAAGDLPSLGRSLPALRAEAREVLATIADALAPDPLTPGRETGRHASDDDGTAPDADGREGGRSRILVHRRLASSWQRPGAEDVIRRALVLLADHELNASTFAARIAASAGSPLSAAALCGLATLSGPLHGGAWQGVRGLVHSAEAVGVRQAVRLQLEQGNRLPAFGHRLYPDGDIRAAALLAHIELPPVYADLRDAGEEMLGEGCNVDFALSALTAAFDLPDDAPVILFALGRSAGWLAHAMEQATGGRLIRPRARYTGPAVAAAR